MLTWGRATLQRKIIYLAHSSHFWMLKCLYTTVNFFLQEPQGRENDRRREGGKERWREGTSSYNAIVIRSWGLYPGDLIQSNHLPEAPPLNASARLRVHPLKISKCGLNTNIETKDRHIQHTSKLDQFPWRKWLEFAGWKGWLEEHPKHRTQQAMLGRRKAHAVFRRRWQVCLEWRVIQERGTHDLGRHDLLEILRTCCWV